MGGDIVIDEDTYQGKPVISICWADDDRYPFSFGVQKAKMLRAALKDDPEFLNKFIEKHGTRK